MNLVTTGVYCPIFAAREIGEDVQKHLNRNKAKRPYELHQWRVLFKFRAIFSRLRWVYCFMPLICFIACLFLPFGIVLAYWFLWGVSLSNCNKGAYW